MKKIIGTISTVIMVAAGLTACAGADLRIAAPKDNERLQKKAAEALKEEGTLQGTPEYYAFSYENEDKTLKITADAEVVVPKKTQIPMYQVECGGFSQELVTKVYDYFFPDGETYRYEGSEMTKAKCQEMIDEVQEWIEAVPKMDDLTEEGKEALLTSYQERLDRLTARYDDLPEEAEVKAVKVDSTLVASVDSTDAGKELGLDANGKAGSLSVTSSDIDAGGWSRLTFKKADGYTYGGFGVEKAEPETADALFEEEIGISYEQAKGIADDFCKQIGVETKMFESFAQTGVKDVISSARGKEIVTEDRHTAYQFFYRRTKDGIPFATTASTLVPDDDDELIWCYEQMSICVEKDGIAYIDWQFPLTVTKTVSEDAALISFADATAVFEELMPMICEEKLAENTTASWESYDVSVESVELCLMRVRDTGGGRTGLLTPAWVFYGNEKTGRHFYDESEKEWVNNESEKDEPFIVFAVNAVDGSMIDLVEGR